MELVNNSTDVTIPSFAATTRLPRTHAAATLQLKNEAGTVVAENTSADRPKSRTTTVAAGRYTPVVTPTGGVGTATLTASYPGRPARQFITYDANDHATSVDDDETDERAVEMLSSALGHVWSRGSGTSWVAKHAVSPSRNVRLAVATWLALSVTASVGGKEATMLQLLSSDDDPEVRRWARFALE